MQFKEADMEKRFGILGDNYLSIPDDDDFNFPKRSVVLSFGMDVAHIQGDHTVVCEFDTKTQQFKVV